MQVSVGGAWSGSLTFGPPPSSGAFVAPVLEIQLVGGKPTVALNFGATPVGLPSRVVLLPLPAAGELAGAGSVLVEAAAAGAVQALVATLREKGSSAALAKVDPALAALGLLAGSGAGALAAFPFGLISDPGGFARTTLGQGGQLDPDRVAGLVDAARVALGLGAAAHGSLALAPAVQLTAGAAATGALQVGLSIATIATGAAQVQLGLTVPPVGPPAPQFAATFSAPGGAVSLQLGLGGPGFTASLHTSAGDVPLLPTCPGLGSVVAAAAQEALPFLLTTLESSGPAPLPAVLGGVRGALGLGSPGFDANELRMLGANPASELARRLAATGAGALPDLAKLLPVLPTPWSIDTSAGIQVTYGKQTVKVSLAGNPAAFTIEGSLAIGIPGPAISVTVDATADSSGLRRMSVSAAVDPAKPLSVGPLSLAPMFEVEAGGNGAPATVSFGLGWAEPSGAQSAVLTVVTSNPPSLSFQTPGATSPTQPDPMVLITNLLVPAVADLALSQSQVRVLLDQQIGAVTGVTVKSLLEGVLLTAGTTPTFDTAVLARADLPQRLARLAANLAPVAHATVADNLVVAVAQQTAPTQLFGLSLSVAAGQRAEIVSGSLSLGLEAADDWVAPPQAPPGLSVLFLSSSGPVAPVITIEGLGLRLYRPDGPLLDLGVQIGSIALFTLLRVTTIGGSIAITDGGVALQLSDLGAPVASASGGDNSVAQGVLGNAQQSGGDNGSPLRPSFSPELSLQKRQGTPSVQWALTAGPGDGPWMLPIDQSFGPLRVADVGFGVDQSGGQVSAVRVLVSGGISLAGLSLDIDALSIGAPWPGRQAAVRSWTRSPGPSTWPASTSPIRAAAYRWWAVSAAATTRRRRAPRRTTSAS